MPVGSGPMVSGLTQSRTDSDDSSRTITVLEMTITFRWVVPKTHLLITFQNGGESSTLEYRVSKEGGQYRMTVVLYGKSMLSKLTERNPLESVILTTEQPVERRAVTASDGLQTGVTTSSQATYRWWDGVYQIIGPSYQVKYHHPDRDYYQIATWNGWSRNGYECSHNQIDAYLSDVLAIGGWATFFSVMAAYLTAGAGGLTAAGAVLVAAVLGFMFGYVTQAVLCDEAGCIWWWWGNDFQNWLMANLWWLVLWGQTGVAIAAAVFRSIGYCRVGSHTFWDAQGLGDP